LINERPLLTVRRDFPRPDSRSVSRFSGAATVHLADAMDGRGALDYRIKAINPGSSAFAGTALTCYAGPDDSLAILAAFEVARPGDVIVAATEAFKGSAVVGDLFAAMAVSAAVSAIVTDGLARDGDGIIATGLPVFASGISPNSAAQSGPGTVGLPVVISGVRIAPGDVVVGDRDGVVVIAQDHLDAVHEQLLAVRAAESSYPRDPGGQVHVPEHVRDLLASEQVRYLS
jgi:4-hydroxy-4-methyl-2-oxoglutarate aldolase